eukprot:scaffold85271_cov18-Tisochrysis_lutea.AAC.2
MHAHARTTLLQDLASQLEAAQQECEQLQNQCKALQQERGQGVSLAQDYQQLQQQCKQQQEAYDALQHKYEALQEECEQVQQQQQQQQQLHGGSEGGLRVQEPEGGWAGAHQQLVLQLEERQVRFAFRETSVRSQFAA